MPYISNSVLRETVRLLEAAAKDYQGSTYTPISNRHRLIVRLVKNLKSKLKSSTTTPS